MSNVQEITIDNLAETLEYNGFIKQNTHFDYDYKLGDFNIYWRDSVLCAQYSNNRDFDFQCPLKYFDVILLAIGKCIKLNPLPNKCDNLWDWALQNGFNEHGKNHQYKLLLVQSMHSYHLHKFNGIYTVYIDCDLPLDKQINLLTTFMEVYGETKAD